MAHSIDFYYGISGATVDVVGSNCDIISLKLNEDGTASAVLQFSGAATSVIQTFKQSLSAAFQQARDRQKHDGAGDRIYVRIQLDGEVTTWTAEVVDGMHDIPDVALGVWWRRKTLQVTVSWSIKADDCGDYGYDGPETELSLANAASPASSTGGITVYNPNVYLQGTTISFDAATREIRDSGNNMARFKSGDFITVRGAANAGNNGTFEVLTGNTAGKVILVVGSVLTNEAAGSTVTLFGAVCNYVEIDAAAVSGDLPGKVRLEMTNLAVTGAGTIWLAHSVHTPTISHILQSDAASGGSNTNSATAAGGIYRNRAMSGTTETTLLTWTLSTTELDKMLGHPFSLFCRFFSDPTTTVKARLKLTDGAITLRECDQVSLDGAQVVALGWSRLPPSLEGLTSISPLQLIMTGQNSAGGGSLDIDYVALMPQGGRGVRKYTPMTGAALDQNQALVDDGYAEALYIRTTAPAKVRRYEAEHGARPAVWPGKTQRFYLLWNDTTTGDATVSRTMTVRLYYRPRRRTI